MFLGQRSEFEIHWQKSGHFIVLLANNVIGTVFFSFAVLNCACMFQDSVLLLASSVCYSVGGGGLKLKRVALLLFTATGHHSLQDTKAII